MPKTQTPREQSPNSRVMQNNVRTVFLCTMLYHFAVSLRYTIINYLSGENNDLSTK